MTGEMLAQFHFLRPEWFYGIIPVVLLFLFLRARHARGSNWERAIDSALLPFLLDKPHGKDRRSPLPLLLLAWVLATVALAGPVFRKLPQPVHEREDALVIVFDLTRSMYATDVNPSRLIGARRKLQDLLAARKEGITALIVFSGDAHTVSPLTDDAETIAEMIPAITPEIMPVAGSALAPALELAIQLFQEGGVSNGRILILTDEIRDVAESAAVAEHYRDTYPASVLAIGTREGAPVLTEHGYLKDDSGVLVIPKVDVAELARFATLAGGVFAEMTLTDEDLDYLLAYEPLPKTMQYRTLSRDFDIWIEEGPWLLLLLLPLAALAFRRGWVWSVALILIYQPREASASWWDDLWQTRDQQAIVALDQGVPEAAAKLFEDPAWRATAQYRSEDFASAASGFAQVPAADGQYNLGNALAKQGDLEKAINAYREALTTNPEHEDASFNLKLVEDLLKQQQEQQQQQKQKQQQEQQQRDNQEQQEDDEQDSGEESAEEQQRKKKEKEKKEKEEQDAKEQQDRSDAEQQEGQESPDPLDEEERQALEQWLRRVPDDPGELLRRKFEFQHLQQQEQQRQSGIAKRESKADW